MGLRRWSILAVLTGVFVVLAAACGGDDPTPTPTPTPTATPKLEPTATPTTAPTKYGGTLHFAERGGIVNLDLSQTGVSPTEALLKPVYSTVLTYKDEPDDMTIVGDLAESWEWTGPKSLKLTLHKGIKWQNVSPVNGRELTADDVVFGLKRIGTDKPTFRNRAHIQHIERYEVQDPYNLVLHLKAPVAAFPSLLANPWNVIYPKELSDQEGDVIRTAAAGSGPYILKNFTPDVRYRSEFNPDYFRGRPFIDALDYEIIKDQATHVAAFKSGRIDITFCCGGWNITIPQARDIKQTMPGATVFELPNVNLYMGPFNTRKPPFDDVRVRKAFMHAINVQQIIDVVELGEAVQVAPLPRIGAAWSLTQADLPKYDLDLARSLLADAGLADGFEVDFIFPEWMEQHLSIIQQNLKPLNITLKPRLMEFSAYLAASNEGNFDVTISTWFGTIEPQDFMSTYYCIQCGRNWPGHNDQVLEPLIAQQAAELDPAKRARILVDIQKRLLDQQYWVWLMQNSIRQATSARLHGYKMPYDWWANMGHAHQFWLDPQ